MQQSGSIRFKYFELICTCCRLVCYQSMSGGLSFTNRRLVRLVYACGNKIDSSTVFYQTEYFHVFVYLLLSFKWGTALLKFSGLLFGVP